MLSRLLGNRKPQVEELHQLLAQGRRYLWRNELSQAEATFTDVRRLAQELADQPRYSLEAQDCILQTELGFWGLNMLRGFADPSDYQRITNGEKVDAETAFFIARVFQSKRDKRPEALQAYQSLLNLSPSVKLAQRIAELLVKLEYSPVGLELLRTASGILKNDNRLIVQLIRWYLLSGNELAATVEANSLVAREPAHIEAHRCLGYLAEKQGDWTNAAHHYRLSRDWLRVAIAYSRLEQFELAKDALIQTPADERHNPTWLYYEGWLQYKDGRISDALKSWRRMISDFPDTADAISKTVSAVTRQLAYEWIRESAPNKDLSQIATLSPEEQGLVQMRLGAALLLKEHDPEASKPLLENAARLLKQNILSEALFLLRVAEAQSGAETDLTIYQTMVKKGRDPSFFMWLRGLSLMRLQPLVGARYLGKAIDDGIAKHLPKQAILACDWIVRWLAKSAGRDQVLPELPVVGLDLYSPQEKQFLWAVLPAYALTCMARGEKPQWIDKPAPGIRNQAWQRVQTFYFLSRRDYKSALESASNYTDEVRWRIVNAAVAHSIRAKEWMPLAEYVRVGLSLRPDDLQLKNLYTKLRVYIRQHMWEASELTHLDRDLETDVLAGKAIAETYHQLAIVYTRLALEKDRFVRSNPEMGFRPEDHRTQSQYMGILEQQAHNDYWQLAIGYWSVILTDNEYWLDWSKQRVRVYGENIGEPLLQELTSTRIPRLLREYHEEQVSQNARYRVHHRFFSAIIDREIEHCRAMRYFLREAKRHRIALHTSLQQYISPLLLKEYGYESVLTGLIERANALALSPYEHDLLRSVSTPLDDVRALVDIREFDLALDRLRELIHDETYAAFHPQVHAEMGRVLGLATGHYIDKEQWEKGYELAREGQRFNPLDNVLEKSLVKALVGWAEQTVRDEDYSRVVNRLENERRDLRASYAELDTLLSEIYVEWAYEAGRDDDLETALRRFEKSLQIGARNSRALLGASACHYQKAIAAAQANRYDDALTSAMAALNYSEDEDTLRLVAMVHRSLAIQANEDYRPTLADNHWIKALDFAERLANLTRSAESLDFYVELGVGRVVFLYSQRNYALALEIGEAIYEMDYDPSSLNVDLGKVLSAICTDYGALLYNNGNHWQGRQLTQKAVRYDPTNSVARQNSYRM